MKRLILGLITAAITLAFAGTAFACYRVGNYSIGSYSVKCSSGKNTAIYHVKRSGKYKVGGLGGTYRSLDAAARAACGC